MNKEYGWHLDDKIKAVSPKFVPTITDLVLKLHAVITST